MIYTTITVASNTGREGTVMAKYDVAIRGGRVVDGAGNPETAIPSEKPFAPASGGAAIRTLPGQDLEVVAWPLPKVTQ